MHIFYELEIEAHFPAVDPAAAIVSGRAISEVCIHSLRLFEQHFFFEHRNVYFTEPFPHIRLPADVRGMSQGMQTAGAVVYGRREAANTNLRGISGRTPYIDIDWHPTFDELLISP